MFETFETAAQSFFILIAVNKKNQTYYFYGWKYVS